MNEAQATAKAELIIDKIHKRELPGITYCDGKVWVISPDRPTILVMEHPDTNETEMEFDLTAELPETERALRSFTGEVAK